MMRFTKAAEGSRGAGPSCKPAAAAYDCAHTDRLGFCLAGPLHLKLPLIELPIDRIVLDELLTVLRHRLGIVAALAQGVAGHAGKLFPAGGDTSFSTAHPFRLWAVCNVYAI